MDSLKQSTEDLNEALQKIKRVQDVMNIAATVINIGTAILSKDIGGVVNGIGEFSKEVSKHVKEEDDDEE
ncbi:MAG: hypothetical protein ABI707_00205 [Ferruginibacter sp.]